MGGNGSFIGRNRLPSGGVGNDYRLISCYFRKIGFGGFQEEVLDITRQVASLLLFSLLKPTARSF